MEQPTQVQLSSEEQALLERCQLGPLFGIYSLKPGFLRFMYWTLLSQIFLSSLFLLGFVAISVADGVPSANCFQDGERDVVRCLLSSPGGFPIVPIFLCCLWLLLGLFFLRVGMQQFRSARIFLCEGGLLAIEKKSWTLSTRCVRWSEVRDLRRGYFGLACNLLLQRGAPLSIELFYQRFDELIAFIEHHVRGDMD